MFSQAIPAVYQDTAMLVILCFAALPLAAVCVLWLVRAVAYGRVDDVPTVYCPNRWRDPDAGADEDTSCPWRGFDPPTDEDRRWLVANPPNYGPEECS